MTTARKLLVACAAAGAIAAGWWATGSAPDESEELERFSQQVWIDRLPQGERDMIRFFIAVTVDDQRVGATGKASAWRQITDMFLWAREEDRITLYFGQDRSRWKARVKVWRCKDGEAPGFELCMKIWDDRHSAQLYSRDDWRIDPDQADTGAAVVELLRSIAPAEAGDDTTGVPEAFR